MTDSQATSPTPSSKAIDGKIYVHFTSIYHLSHAAIPGSTVDKDLLIGSLTSVGILSCITLIIIVPAVIYFIHRNRKSRTLQVHPNFSMKN